MVVGLRSGRLGVRCQVVREVSMRRCIVISIRQQIKIRVCSLFSFLNVEEAGVGKDSGLRSEH